MITLIEVIVIVIFMLAASIILWFFGEAMDRSMKRGKYAKSEEVKQ